MGNLASTSDRTWLSSRAISQFEDTDYNFIQELGGRSNIRTIKCIHKEGPIVIKVFLKPIRDVANLKYRRDEEIIVKGLRELENITIRLPIKYNHNVFPFQRFENTPDACYAIRQYFYNSLHARIGTRPFLSTTEKYWIIFQLFKALHECHNNEICHGDIKPENIMLTSWNWVYLTDFASYKPTVIPEDSPMAFSNNFDTGRRSCYLAPERFGESGENPNYSQAHPSVTSLTPAMDLFSLGCVIAELFLDGTVPLFTLGELINYCKTPGSFEPIDAKLDRIPIASIRSLVRKLISINPKHRGSAVQYLNNQICDDNHMPYFPSYFRDLHDYLYNLMKLSAEHKIIAIYQDFDKLQSQITRSSEIWNNSKHNTDADGLLIEEERMNLLNMSSLSSSYLSGSHDLKRSTIRDTESFIFRLQTSQIMDNNNNHNNNSSHSYAANNSNSKENTHTDGFIVILSVVCSVIPEIKSNITRMTVLHLLKSLSQLLDDKSRLQIILPWVISLTKLTQEDNTTTVTTTTTTTTHSATATVFTADSTHPSNAAVTSCAISVLTDILNSVDTFPPSDISIFKDYIIPVALVDCCKPKLSIPSKVLIRTALARNLSKLATISLNFSAAARQTIALTSESLLETKDMYTRITEFEIEQDELRAKFQSMMKMLLPSTDDIKQAQQNYIDCNHPEWMCEWVSAVGTALLPGTRQLAEFFGPVATVDFLLPWWSKVLNEDYWSAHPHSLQQLSCTFYYQFPELCHVLQPSAIESILIPVLLNNLYQMDEVVTSTILISLSKIIEKQENQSTRDWVLKLSKTLLLSIIDKVALFLTHPGRSLRRCVRALFEALWKNLSTPVDRHRYIFSAVKPYIIGSFPSPTVNPDIVSRWLFENSKPPLSRYAYNWAIQESESLVSSVEESTSNISASFASKMNNLMTHSSHLLKSTNDREMIVLFSPLLERVAKRVMRNKIRIERTMQQQQYNNHSPVNPLHVKNYPRPLAGSINYGNNNNSTNSLLPSYSSSPHLHRSQHNESPGMNVPVYSDDVGLGIDGLSIYHGSEPISKDSGTGKCFVLGLGESQFQVYTPFIGYPRAISGDDALINESHQINECSQSILSCSVPYDPLDIGTTITTTDIGVTLKTSNLSSSSSTSSSSWMPTGKLIGHLHEHTKRVNQIAVSSDQQYFVSCSDDKSFLVWDLARCYNRVDKRSDVQYKLDQPVKAVCNVTHSHSVLLGDRNGQLLLNRIDVLSTEGKRNKYSGFTPVNEFRYELGDESICEILQYSDWVFNIVTAQSMIYGIDIRCKTPVWQQSHPANYGIVQCATSKRNEHWLVTGTSRGMYSCWDQRVNVLSHSWKQTGSYTSISKMCVDSSLVEMNESSSRINACVGNSVINWNVDKAENTDIDINDIYSVQSAGTLKLNPRNQTNSISFDNPDVYWQSLSDYKEAPTINGSTNLSVCCIPETGNIVAGNSDGCIRCWNLNLFASSTIISGWNTMQSTYSSSDPSHYEYSNAIGKTNDVGHRDAVTALSIVDYPSRMLVSASRDGVIKLWM